MKDISIRVDDEINGLIVNIIGHIDFDDIDFFKKILLTTIHKDFVTNKFTLLINGYGYLPKTISVHSYYSNFLKNTKLIVDNCKAVAHVHHSKEHINDLLPYMNDFQGFFNDFEKAYLWLKERK